MTEITPELVEETFCKKLDDMDAKTPLSRDQFEVFMGLTMMPDEALDDFNSGMVHLISDRAMSLNLIIDKKTVVMLSFLADTPGTAVMYIYYLAYKAKERDKRTITFDDFIEIFPDGYFSKSQLDEAWRSQKMDGMNLLDIKEASLSLNINT